MQFLSLAKRHPWLFFTRLVFLTAVGFLSLGSLMPKGYLPAHHLKDKVLHFAGYAVVSLLALIAIRSPQRQLVALMGLTLLGIALEFGQLFVPGRAFEIWDMVANACGVLVAFQAIRLATPIWYFLASEPA